MRTVIGREAFKGPALVVADWLGRVGSARQACSSESPVSEHRGSGPESAEGRSASAALLRNSCARVFGPAVFRLTPIDRLRLDMDLLWS
ncbi:hypothetical protein AOLI_G00178900 [Acnodon oligacanthus]